MLRMLVLQTKCTWQIQKLLFVKRFENFETRTIFFWSKNVTVGVKVNVQDLRGDTGS